MQHNKTALGTAPMGKLMLGMAIPSVVAQLVNLLYNIVDRIYIGQGINGTALTGVGLCMPLMMFMNAFAMLAGSGGAPRAAIAMGRGDRAEASKIMSNSLTLLLIFSAGITALYLLFAEPMLTLFGASPDTLPYAMDYMSIISVGAVFTLIVMGMNPYLTTQGFSNMAMMTTVLGAVINIILDPIFIFALDMGVAGAALATVLSQAVGAMWVLLFLTKNEKSLLKITPAYMKPEGRIVGGTLALGISGFVMVATESLLSISFNSSLQRYGGDLAVGSMTILTSCAQLAQMPASGIAQGCQPIVSFNYGAGNRERVKQCFRLQLLAAAGYTTLFWAATMLFPQLFVQIFNRDAALVEHTVWAMRIYMAGIFSLGFQLTCQQSFVALGQAKISLLMACLRKLILLIPLIFILPLFFENKVFAVFLAEPVSDIIAAAVTTGTFFARFDKILHRGPAGK
ncbi:MAG: MATE family efflux transporter [Oscillospiraceae bacterium]|nr:MATE family efflux transporter [Oscillospiraceae bacterium]